MKAAIDKLKEEARQASLTPNERTIEKLKSWSVERPLEALSRPGRERPFQLDESRQREHDRRYFGARDRLN